MPLILLTLSLLLPSARAQDTLLHDADVRRALAVLARDAEVAPEAVRTAPLYFGERVDVVGGLRAASCADPVSGEVLAEALRDAETYAALGATGPTLDALQVGLDALGCLDVPLRSWEAARLHDLASAVRLSLSDDEGLALFHATQALLIEPDHAFEFQVDAALLREARGRAREAAASLLVLPPGIWQWRILVDGRPATGPEVSLPAGEHIVQVLGAPVVTLRVSVPEVAARAALLVPDLEPASLDLDEAPARAWLSESRARWGERGTPAWAVVRGRLWRDEGSAVWSRYERRPPRVLRPAFLSLTAAGVAGGAVLAGVSWSRWVGLDGCGSAGAPDLCGSFVDATSGLIVDGDGWARARRTQSAWGITGVAVGVVSASLLAVVAARSRSPRAVQVVAVPTWDGVAVALSGGLP